MEREKARSERDLTSLIGSLAHACKGIRLGCLFVRRLMDLSERVAGLNHFVRLNAKARSDIEWWFTFVEDWNGVLMMYHTNCLNCSIL